MTMIADSSFSTHAKKHQTTELNIKREYLQHLFLSYFYQQNKTDKIYFKGGTALRILYHSPRFSEDLDFSSNITDVRLIESTVIDTLNEIEREGIKVIISESKKTSGGYLAIISFNITRTKIDISLEISLRAKKSDGSVTTVVSDFIPPFTLIQLRQELLVAEKIRALIMRGKARDYYDLYFILRGNLLRASEKHILSKVMGMLKKTRINFDKELKQFLPRSHHPIIKNFKKTLGRELEKYI